MDHITPPVRAKRARLSEPGPIAAMQLSTEIEQLGADTQPADVLAFFAERGSRAHALQSEIAQLQQQAQQQATKMEASQLQEATLRVRNKQHLLACFALILASMLQGVNLAVIRAG